MLNPSPVVIDKQDNEQELEDEQLDALRDAVYTLIRWIRDPEHDYTIEQLGIVNKQSITFPAYHSSCQSPAPRLPDEQSIED
ncbi:hypothetical protein HDU85_001974, partial [Gaertneriomyces sp. JEL0708]